jgi:hypothetical protein
LSSPAKSRTPESKTDPWSYDYRDDPSSSLGVEDIDFDEILTCHEDKQSSDLSQSSVSDSDVVVLANDATPRPRAKKPASKHCKVVKRPIMSEDRESDSASGVITMAARQAPKPLVKKGKKERDVGTNTSQANSALGQTKRKKKAETKETTPASQQSHSWLLSDIDSD